MECNKTPINVGHPLVAIFLPKIAPVKEYIAGLDNKKNIRVPYKLYFTLRPVWFWGFPIVRKLIRKNTKACTNKPA
jgi:hypothetical protein